MMDRALGSAAQDKLCEVFPIIRSLLKQPDVHTAVLGLNHTVLSMQELKGGSISELQHSDFLRVVSAAGGLAGLGATVARNAPAMLLEVGAFIHRGAALLV